MSKNITFSKHAIERMRSRGIPENEILLTLDKPDSVINETDCKQIFQRLITRNKNTLLLRVFVNQCKEPPLVITAYKTSKIDKYEH